MDSAELMSFISVANLDDFSRRRLSGKKYHWRQIRIESLIVQTNIDRLFFMILLWKYHVMRTV